MRPDADVHDPKSFDWTKFGREISVLFKTAPGVSCMLGPLDAQPKVGFGSRVFWSLRPGEIHGLGYGYAGRVLHAGPAAC